MFQQDKIEGFYTAAAVRKLDATAIKHYGIPSFTLMQRAAQFAFEVLLARFPLARSICVLCGAGNNAGDGYLLACLARAHGLHVEVVSVTPIGQLQGDAALAAAQWLDVEGVKRPALPAHLPEADVYIDALLGTGLSRPVQGDMLWAITAVNALSVHNVLALDIPSGLCANTGQPQPVAIEATYTASFVAAKIGLAVGDGPNYVGQCYLSTLHIPVAVYAAAAAICLPLLEHLPVVSRRKPVGHKGLFGNVLVVGGGLGMGGAACLAAQAALRVGAGVVTVACHPDNVAGMWAAMPELMCHGLREENVADTLMPLLDAATVVVVGPGLGESTWASNIMHIIKTSTKSVVADASALRWLAQQQPQRYGWTLTPHPGEAAGLLGISTANVQQDRISALNSLVEAYGGYAVLKGAGSLVNDDRYRYLCSAGNPGMSVAGMGDVLSGIIAGLCAQGLPQADSLKLGVYLHAHAADIAAQQGMNGMLPSDLLPVLRQLCD